MAESKYPVLYHATRNEFSRFRLNGDGSKGCNRGSTTNTSGVGIYLFSELDSAEHTVKNYYDSFVRNYEYQSSPNNPRGEKNLNYQPFFDFCEKRSKMPEEEARLYGAEERISIDGMPSLPQEFYERYLADSRNIELRLVSQAIKICMLSDTVLSKEALKEKLKPSIVDHNTPEEVNRLIDIFAGKRVEKSLCPEKFKGRVLRVRIADDCKLFDKSKSVAENGITFDLEGICNVIEPNPQANPTAFAKAVVDLLTASSDTPGQNTPKELLLLHPVAQKLITDYNQSLGKATETMITDSFSGSAQSAKELASATNKLITQSKKLLQKALNMSTHGAIMLFSSRLFFLKKIPPLAAEKMVQYGAQGRPREVLLSFFDFDGFVSYNSSDYKQDIYSIRNLDKLTIEAYKPYGSNEWIPVEQPKEKGKDKKKETLDERLLRFRNGGLEA